MDCGLLGSSVHGIFQARVLEWDAIAFSALWSEQWPKNVLQVQTRVGFVVCVCVCVCVNLSRLAGMFGGFCLFCTCWLHAHRACLSG